MIPGKNKSKILTKDISCKNKFSFDKKNVIQIDRTITINIDVSAKNVMHVKKIIFGITCSCENGKYLASIMNDSAITCEVKKCDKKCNYFRS